MAIEVLSYFASSPLIFVLLFFGVAAGITIGVMPGLTATMAVALILPITFGMSASYGILLLIGVYKGAIFGGYIPAILLKTPGTPASAATAQDGYEFAKRGEAGRALGIGAVASFVGGIISVFFVILIAPQLARFALQFSSPEFFMLAVFGLTIISGVSGKSMTKGLLVGFLGIIISTIGIDIITGYTRYTFGNINLLGGVPFIPALIGLFAMSEALANVETIYQKTMEAQKVDRIIPTKEDLKRTYKSSGVAGVIGTFIGIVPGAGAEIAAFVTYNVAKQTAKKPEEFGTGVLEGIAAPESANNASTGGALIPMLTLGIPGDATTAILIGALTIQGLQPGPLLFQDHPVLVYTIFVGMLLANIFMLILGLSTVRLFSKVLAIPKTLLIPIIMILSIVGSYAINMNFFDIWVMMFFGILGYIFKKLDMPIAPITIGLVLGPLAERHFRTSLIMSGGELSIFFNSPIAIFFLVMSIVTIFLPILRKYVIVKKN